MADVFISYAREDRATARKLATARYHSTFKEQPRQ